MSPVAPIPAQPGTLVGTTNAGPRAVVDVRGSLVAVDGDWSLDWWVGADDRWHVPRDETAVRQRLVDATPVVETAMRVPTGDAVARAFGARVGGIDHDLAVVEVANETTLPFALAVVLVGAREVVVDGAAAVIDGTTEVCFARAPSRAAAGSTLEEVSDTVLAGEATEITGTVRGRAVAVLFPLAHTARLRSTIGARTSVGDEGRAQVTAAPEAEQVARGWRTQLDRGVALRLPDERLAAAVDQARAQLLLAAAGPLETASVADLALLVTALAHQGFAAEAVGVVPALLARQRLNGRFGRGPAAAAHTVAALRALGELWRATHDGPVAEALVGPVAKAAHRVSRDRPAPAGLAGALAAAIDLLAGAEQPDAARALADRAAAACSPAEGRAARPPDPRPLDDLLQEAVLLDPRLLGGGLSGGAMSDGRMSDGRMSDGDGGAAVAPDRDDGVPVGSRRGLDAGRGAMRLEATGEVALAGTGSVEGDPVRYAGAAAVLLERVRAGLVDDAGPEFVPTSPTSASASPASTESGDGLRLFGGFPGAWFGQAVEVHDVPTRFGLLSGAVRWHGERAALLWDLRPSPSTGASAPPPLLTAPALDPSWSSHEPRGEALLAAPAPPSMDESFS